MSAHVLAFDTSTEVCAIGLGRRDRSGVHLVASRDFDAPRAAMSGLLPAVRALLAESRVSLDDIAEVVVGTGPGSFTGVRIGVATAKGVARGLGVPLYGVSTLEAVARRLAAAGGAGGIVGIVGDAMRGEVYPALFEVAQDANGDARVLRLTEDSVAKPAAAAQRWAADVAAPLLLAGNGLAKYADVFAAALGERAVIASAALWAPTGAGLLAAHGAQIEAGAEGDGDPAGVLPVYTRLSDAEEAERARAGLASQSPPPSGVGGPA